jgi:Fic family protein
MMTLRQLAAEPPTLPTRAAWYLTDLAEARGKQELFTRQSPQKLKALREHALIESAISSNRIEGVEVDKSRIGTLIFGKPALRDRDEEEVRGYRDALKLIHESGANLPISEATIKRLHKLGCWQIQGKGRGHHPNLRRWPEPCPLQNRSGEEDAQGYRRDGQALAGRCPG